MLTSWTKLLAVLTLCSTTSLGACKVNDANSGDDTTGRDGIVSSAVTSDGAAIARMDLSKQAVLERAGLPSSDEILGPLAIKNALSGMCLNVPDESTDPGTPIIQWPCGSIAPNDLWYWDVDKNQFINALSGQCLNVSNASFASGAPVIQWPCDSPRQNDEWFWNGAGRMINLNSGQCLNVRGASVTRGAAIIQWPCGSSLLNDIWFLD